MPRPTKCRKVCYFPQTLEFLPADDTGERPPVLLTVDEYETIRLIDKEGLSQERCSEFMQVARTTVQKVYEGARKKLADALVDGRPLRIEGGEFRLCDGQSALRGCRGCYKRLYAESTLSNLKKEKGEHVMRVAVTYENGEIFQHFGHTEQFKIYDITDGRITASDVADTNGSGHGALADLLSALQVDALICGGIGGGAQTALAAAGITLYGGVSGEADKAVEALIAGTLEYNSNVQCEHHAHGNHDCGGSHTCGEHH